MNAPEEKEPLGGWRRLYLLLVAELVVVILVCAAIAAWRA